jgi:lysyl-tRNA synthetase class 2
MTPSSPWWDREVYADRRPFLAARGRIQAALREWFAAQGFVEVETPILQVSPGNEIHLHALSTEIVGPDGARAARHLHTSPEFACKKLLAAGETKIFTFARVFRNRERGPLHHPEFTMLEWYRANEPYEAVMADCAAMVALAAQAADAKALRYKDKSADVSASPDRVSVAAAFQRFAGIDLLATLPGGKPDRVKLAAAARAAGIQIATDDTWSDVFSRILVERIEPNLGIGRLTLLDEYPAPEAALARAAADPRVAQRFELYACGVELANGYGELTDPSEQRRRFDDAMAERQRRYGERYPIDPDFIAALAKMPPASGVALGFDRLVMLAAGATQIEQVLWAPVADSDRR